MRHTSALAAMLTLLVASVAAAQPEEASGSEGPSSEPPAAEAPSSEPADSVPPSSDPERTEPERPEAPARAEAPPPTPAPRPASGRAPSSTTSSESRGGATGAAPRTSAAAGRAPRYEDPDYARTGPREGEEEEPPAGGGDPYDFLWIEAFGGLSFVDLRALSQNNFYPDIVRLQGEGPAGGAAVGFRIEFVSIGVRAAVAHYGDEFDVGTAVGEIALSIPLPIVKPYLRAGFGFAWHGDSNYMAPADSQTTVFGWAFSAAVGVDIYLVEWFAIGAAFNVDVLNMSRSSIDDPMPAPGAVVFEDPGDAVGAQLRGQLAVSFHF